MRTLFAVLALLVAGAVCAQGVRYRVEVDAPRDMAATLRKGLSLERWKDDPQMTEERLRRLAAESEREAREVAATEGYFSPRVEVRIDESQSPWSVMVKVDPGERTRVSHVEIRFSGPAAADPEARELFHRVRDRWRLRSGEPFRQADWDAAKREAARELASWRYAAARVADSQATIDPEKREARLDIELASGPAFRFGPVRVTGLKRYADAVAENLNPIREGQTYDRDLVLTYQRRLLESGYFASVQAEIDTHPLLADAAPLRVSVIEASSQHVETGIGYNTDGGARAELSYSNQDVFDSAWRFKSALRVDQKIQQLDANLDTPPRPGGRWNSVFGRARQADIQNETTRELSLGVSHNLYDRMAPIALIVSGHLEEQNVGGDVTDNRAALYFGHRRSFRQTDDLLFPREGYLGTIEIGGAPPGLASREFFRVTGNASLLLAIGRNGDLLLRGQAGVVAAKTREGIPTTFLFRTGGDQTVRGYAFESLGVRQGDAIVGGRRLAVGSVEYTHWIGDNWGLAVFTDAGNAWDEGTTFEPALGYGVGARFRTPIGPIRADLAYGQKTSEFRIHFSVGYTF
ncbi:MAG TPA: autotransporter assembly complex family protein [Burkholderiales bacterium]